MKKSKKDAEERELREEITSEFDMEGTIVITDPCYLDSVKELIPTHSRDTIYGDWGCSVWAYNPEEGKYPKEGAKPFGKFCADSGQVCVTAVKDSELKAFNEWLGDRDWIATVIHGFKGKVRYVEVTETYTDDKGKEREYTSLRVQGEGTKDGKSYAFISAQTSL